MGVWWAGQLEFGFCDVKVAIFLSFQAGGVKTQLFIEGIWFKSSIGAIGLIKVDFKGKKKVQGADGLQTTECHRERHFDVWADFEVMDQHCRWIQVRNSRLTAGLSGGKL